MCDLDPNAGSLNCFPHPNVDFFPFYVVVHFLDLSDKKDMVSKIGSLHVYINLDFFAYIAGSFDCMRT